MSEDMRSTNDVILKVHSNCDIINTKISAEMYVITFDLSMITCTVSIINRSIH